MIEDQIKYLRTIEAENIKRFITKEVEGAIPVYLHSPDEILTLLKVEQDESQKEEGIPTIGHSIDFWINFKYNGVPYHIAGDVLYGNSLKLENLKKYSS